MYKQPLVLKIFFVVIISLILFNFADYSVKKQLADIYTADQIGTFLSILFAISMLVVILSQLFIVPIIIKRFGVTAMIMIFLIVLIVFTLLLFLYPTLWAAAIILSGAFILRYAFSTPGRQMVLNVVPSSYRLEARFQITSLGYNLGVIFCGVLLIFFKLCDQRKNASNLYRDLLRDFLIFDQKFKN